MTEVRVLSWNVERLKAGGARIADEILRHQPEIVVLQEFQPGHRGEEVTCSLGANGFRGVHLSPVGKGFCSAIFSASSLEPRPNPNGLPPNHWATYWVEAKCGELGVSCIHVPVSRYVHERRAFQETALRHCARLAKLPHILIGDFNASPDALIEPTRKVAADKWLRELDTIGWQEAWRTCNPGRTEFSCYTRMGHGFRLDQAWLSPSAIPSLLAARYDHQARDEGLSDHSLLVIDLAAGS